MNEGALTLVVHGESGTGKSWLGDTGPAPRLILDAEGGSQFLPSVRRGEGQLWDPARWAPPGEPDCDPEQPALTPTTRVMVRDFGTMSRVYQWLNAGRHHFRSLVIDSLTEIQKRCLDAIVGTSMPQTQDWGVLLTQMEALVRQLRDLTFHPTRPLTVVQINCLTTTDKRGILRPFVKGQLQETLPGFVDVVGYLYTEVGPTGALVRRLLVQAAPGYAAKDRTGRLGAVLSEPDVQDMLARAHAPANDPEEGR